MKNGNLCYELARPKNLYFMWYFKVLGQRLANVVMRFLPLVIVVSLLPSPFQLGGACSVSAFFLFLLSLGIGALLVTALSVLYPIITLRTLNEKGIVNIVIVLADILSGVVVPIPFFPEVLQDISRLLPFQYISDLPFRIYVGDIGISAGLGGIVIQFIWLFLLIIIGFFIMKHSMKRVVVQGG